SLPLFHTLTHPSCCYQWKWDSQTTVFHPAGHKTWEPRLGSVFRAQDSGLRAQAHTHSQTHPHTHTHSLFLSPPLLLSLSQLSRLVHRLSPSLSLSLSLSLLFSLPLSFLLS